MPASPGPSAVSTAVPGGAAPAAGAAPAGIASRAREVCEAPADPDAVPKCYVFETPGERPAAAAGYARAPPAPGAPPPYGPLHPAAPITVDAGRG